MELQPELKKRIFDFFENKNPEDLLMIAKKYGFREESEKPPKNEGESNFDYLMRTALHDETWRLHVEFRMGNKDWLDHASDLALAILNRLDDLNMTKEELANKINMDIEDLTLILKGRVNSSLKIISSIEKALDRRLIDIDYKSEEEKNERIPTDEELKKQMFKQSSKGIDKSLKKKNK